MTKCILSKIPYGFYHKVILIIPLCLSYVLTGIDFMLLCDSAVKENGTCDFYNLCGIIFLTDTYNSHVCLLSFFAKIASNKKTTLR